MTLDEEGERATTLLKGKIVKRVIRFREQEVLVEFEDGTRLYADAPMPLELSVTEGPLSDDDVD